MRKVTLRYRRATAILLAILFLSPLKMFSQAGDLDQIRNGPANDPAKYFYNNFNNPTYVNGNAGASNAHYVESHSISYRSLITGTTNGSSYQYVIEYDTKHSDRMAIDYLTHYQRLQPHQQFGHPAEVINPLIMVSGSNEYIMGTNFKDTMSFPIPSSVGSPVANLPTNSFKALPDSERVLTAYNADITNIQFVFQQSLTNGATESASRIIITFMAKKDSVLLAWGGHIANRNEWGFLAGGIPRSAGGINGSPYHMRQISMNTFPALVNISGVGNQDRSLSANAVIAPPVCGLSSAQLACPETASLTFNYTGGTTGATFVWSIFNNTANASISGSNTGSSVTIVPGGGGKFTAGGSFSLKIVVTANGLKDSCTLSPAGTIQNVQVVASANPTTINFATGNTSQLNAVITPAPSTDYTIGWTQDPTTGGSLSSTSITNPVFTATEAGTYTFIVTATQKAAPNCVAKDTVTVTVESSAAPCGISGPAPVCPGSTHTYKYDPDNNGVADPIPANFTLKWSLINNTNGATFNGGTTDTTVSVTAGVNCGTNYTLKIVITSTSGLIKDSCTKTVGVNVNSALDITCPGNKNVTCSESKLPANTGTPTVADNGCGIKVYYKDVITRTWIAQDACGHRDTCTQTITVTDSCVTTNTLPNNGARMITSSDPAPAAQGFTSPSVSSPVRNRINGPALPSATSVNTASKELQVQAFPNPFSNTVNFRFTSPVSGRAILEVFNTQGQRVGIAFDGKIDAGITKFVQFSTRLNNQALIYRLKVGEKTVRGTVLELNK